jgi:nucleolar complex protein 3
MILLCFFFHRFASLIDVNHVIDVMTILKDLIRQDNLSFESSLHCTYTGLQILSDKNDLLELDPREFYRQLYCLMLDLENYREELSIDLLLKCLELSFLKKKQLSLNRVAAFIKRLATISLHLSIRSLTKCLIMIGRMFQVGLFEA